MLLQNGGYLSIFTIIVLTGCGLPLPEEVPIVVAGVLSAKGTLEPTLAFGACLFGAIAGDSMIYAIGYRYGHSLVRRHPHLAKFVGAEREEHFERAIQRHAFKVLLLARFMIGVRGPVYLAAGVMRMPYRKFLLYDLISATIVVGAFFGLSYAYGVPIITWIREAELTATLVAAAVGLGALLLYLRRRRLRALDEVIHEEMLHEEALQAAGNDPPVASDDEEAPIERRA
ncbi:MAG: DedA family protein [Planctomycetota bacterium]